MYYNYYDYIILFYDKNGKVTCFDNDIKYITDRIYECFRGVFENIIFYVKEHSKTNTLQIYIEGYKKAWDFSIELNKKINGYAEEINRIIEYINKNTK